MIESLFNLELTENSAEFQSAGKPLFFLARCRHPDMCPLLRWFLKQYKKDWKDVVAGLKVRMASHIQKQAHVLELDTFIILLLSLPIKNVICLLARTVMPAHVCRESGHSHDLWSHLELVFWRTESIVLSLSSLPRRISRLVVS